MKEQKHYTSVQQDSLKPEQAYESQKSHVYYMIKWSINFLKYYRCRLDIDDFYHILDLLPKERALAVLKKGSPASLTSSIDADTLNEDDIFQQLLYEKDLEWKKLALPLKRVLSYELQLHMDDLSGPKQQMDTLYEKKSDKDPIIQRLNQVSAVFKLNAVDWEFLLLRQLYSTKRTIEVIYDQLDSKSRMGMTLSGLSHHVSVLTGTKRSQFLNAIKSGSPLRRSGLLEEDGDLNSHLISFLDGLQDSALDSTYLDTNGHTELNLDKLVLEKTDLAMLRHLFAKKTVDQPLNILLHGVPGTGKTELAKCLAAETGRKFYSIKSEGGRRDGAFRIQALVASDSLLNPDRDLVVVDEVDNLLNLQDGFANKAMLNSYLEGTPMARIWITNHSLDIDPSTMRRFDFAMEFKALSEEGRIKVWNNIIEDKLEFQAILGEEEIKIFARRFPVNSGGISSALHNLKPEVGEEKDAVLERLEILLEAHATAIGVQTLPQEKKGNTKYGLDGLNVSGDLDELVADMSGFCKHLDQLGKKQQEIPNMNILLYGEPGTGKTAFVTWLARKLGRKLVKKSASALLDMYVGGTEKNIRQAFAEAEKEGSILFLDEADSLFMDRSNAQRGWEVSQVNELLTGMENFRGILICATNFRDYLDKASLRRFAHKLEFKPLTADGSQVFFRRYFKARMTKVELEKGELAATLIPDLVPGDFYTAHRKFFFRKGKLKADTLVKVLREEVRLRNGASSRTMGFARG